MKHFLKIAEGVHVMPLLHAIQRNPELWDQHNLRKTFDQSPHVQVSDIWLRFDQMRDSDEESIAACDGRALQWYPAADVLAPWKPIVLDLMRAVGAFELSRLIVTRLVPGQRIAAHRDTQGAYANDQEGSRYHVVLQGLPGSLFRADDETVTMRTGEVWWFDHKAEHEVVNNSADDRIHLLVDLKVLR